MRKIMFCLLGIGLITLSCKKYDALGREIQFEERYKASFLEGNWTLTDSMSVMEMQWKEADDSTYTGTCLFIHGEKKDTLHREQMEVQQRKNYLIYTTTVQGEKGETPISFQMTQDADSTITFENPDNDYPKKIVYRLLRNGKLQQTESGQIRKKAQTQTYLWSKGVPPMENKDDN